MDVRDIWSSGRAVAAVLLFVVACGVLVSPTGTASADLPAPLTAASFDGEPGHYISQSNQFTSVTAGLRGSNILTFVVSTPGVTYNVWFAPPGAQQMTVGTYEAAERADFRAAGHPGIDIFGMGRGCNTVAGRFIVDQIELDPGGVPTVFSARFEHHCEGSNPALFGSISYNATADYRWHNPSASEVDFTDGVGAAATIAMFNAGPSTLTMYPTVITGPDADDFQIVADGCAGVIVPVNQSCPVTVTFLPTGPPGPRTAYVTFFDDVSPPGGSGRDVYVHGLTISAAGEFTPVTPQRILDTRDGTGGFAAPLGPRTTYDVDVTGVGGVPEAGVSAVVMNATATNGTAPTFVTVWPSDVPRPENSNLNLLPGQTNPNLVTVAVGANGKVGVYNENGSTDVIFDVVGFYSTVDGPRGSRFVPLSPFRLFDTRNGAGGVAIGALAADRTLTADVYRFPVVPRDATGIVMNVTATETTAAGFLSVYPADVGRPVVSNLNFGPGRTVPNLVTVRVPADGLVAFYNAYGATHVLADVVGYYQETDVGELGRFVGLAPERALDTRTDGGALGPDELGILTVAGFSGVPSVGARAVVLNLTATQTTSAGFVSAFPDDACDLPGVSNLNFGPGETIPNLAIVRLSTNTGCAVGPGRIDIYNAYGDTHIIVDVFGYFT
jgi:hypothetical protein